MARKKPADAAKDKAAKQKKMVVILAVLLVLAMAYAVKTMGSLNSGGASASKPQAVASSPVQTSAVAPAPATATPAAPSLAGTPAPAAPAATPAPATSATPGTDSSQLVAVAIPTADPGQLTSFSRFASKDPFASSLSTTSGGSSSSAKKGSGSGAPPATPPAPPAPPPTTAVISVNGTSESVQSGTNFPLANPVATTNGLFQLVSLTATTATISVVGGSYATGSQTLTLHVNKPVTLVNTADGTRYTLVLYPQGTVVAASAGGAAPASGSSSAVPATPSTTTTTSGG